MEKKGSILGSVLDVFSTEVPEKPSPTRNTPVPAAPVAMASAPVAADPKLVSSLEARLNAALPAPYAAFLEMYQSLAEDIPDESKRMKVAMKTSKTSVDDILHALDQLTASMAKAKEDFGHSLEKQQQVYNQLTQEIQSTVEQIAALQKSLDEKRTEASAGLLKIEQTQKNFESAHTQVLNKLEVQKASVAKMRQA